ncbi:aldolase [Candidatus Dependentiae bacterium]|nr:aldolase [Candidatus Dependentiae bacterium]
MLKKINIPLTVPKNKKDLFMQNYKKATKNSDKLFLFAGDQKIEHLNKDFYGPDIAKEDNDPKHMFQIASKSPIGVFATQLGLIAQYGSNFKNINYIIKLNSKTDLVSVKQSEPISSLLNNIDDVIKFKKDSNLPILGIGYTIYLGSEHESQMLSEASKIIFQAHQNGLLTILWMYPRGKAVKNDHDANLIAGATGVASSLGADFVKINPPKEKTSLQSAQKLKIATTAAGKTKVICSGGTKKDEKEFLQELSQQIKIGKTFGCAVGRNIHQRSLKNAIKFCEKIVKIIF